MLCPLSDPYRDHSPSTKLCTDKQCSVNCSSKARAAPFGVQFLECTKPFYTPVAVTKPFWEEFVILKILSSTEKGSASKSAIAFGKHVRSNTDVVIKMFSVYDDYESEVSNLTYEMLVYEKMKTLAQQIPHFIMSVATYTYNDAELAQQSSQLKDIASELDRTPPSYLPTSSFVAHAHKIMVNLRAEGVPLHQFFSAEQPFETVKSVLFQILFCIHAMSVSGFQHNDLHSFNIFVNNKPNCTKALYFLEDETFLVPLPAFISIYDFDLSSCSLCGPNYHLDENGFCTNYGVCNARNPRFDMYTIFRYLQSTLSVVMYPEISDIINFALGKTPVFEKYPYRMCNLTAHAQCQPFAPSQPDTILTPEQVIFGYFQEYLDVVPPTTHRVKTLCKDVSPSPARVKTLCKDVSPSPARVKTLYKDASPSPARRKTPYNLRKKRNSLVNLK